MFDKAKLQQFIQDVISQDKVLMQTLEELKNNKLTLSDLFRGSAKEKLRILIKGLSTFAVIFMEDVEKSKGITEVELVDVLVDYLKDKISKVFGWKFAFVSPFITPILHYLITYAMEHVKSASVSSITTLYAKSICTVKGLTFV